MAHVQQEGEIIPLLSSQGGSVDAITVRDLTHNFGSVNVMNGLNMTVKRGTIFGLLGPSGCGKTTLLKILLGQVIPDQGIVRVLGEVPGESDIIPGSSVGYAPQEIALYSELSVEETLAFHGRLHRMDSLHFAQRRSWLLDFLDLPTDNRRVRDLSGGQKRRLSLAVAMIHNPELLILDEPTVGVDPELRARIWGYLREVASSGTTIIITTHYIEEAAASDRVGLMRKGRLLAEDAPRVLMERFGHRTLEDVFLDLCKRESSASAKKHHHQESSPALRPAQADPRTETRRRQQRMCSNFMIGIALMWRKMTSLRKDYRVVVMAVVNPTVQIALLSIAIGLSPQYLPFGVVNEDSGYFFNNFGNAFVSTLQNNYSDTFILSQYSDLASGLAAVESGQVWGIAYLGSNFTYGLYEKFIACSHDPNIGNYSSVSLYMDMSNEQIAITLLSEINDAFITTLDKYSPTPVSSPVNLVEAVYGSTSPRFIDFLAPGMITMVCFAYSLILTAVAFTAERTTMTLDRVLAAGARPFEIVWGSQGGTTPLFIVQLCVLLFFSFLVFDIPLHGSIVLIFCLGLCLGVTSMSLGMLIASVCSSDFDAIQLSTGLFFPIQILSGVLWPLQGMPRWVQYISNCLPTTWVAEAFRAIMIRGWGITHPVVWQSFLVTLAWGSFFFAAAVYCVRPPLVVQRLEMRIKRAWCGCCNRARKLSRAPLPPQPETSRAPA